MPDTDRFELPPPWRTCTEADCQGKQLSSADGRCFAHASNDERAQALEMLSTGAPLDFAAGVHFTEDLLVELLAALPRDAAEHWILQKADFRDATLPSVDLQGASFKGDAMFDGTSFQGDAEFDGANFQGVALFTEASFHGVAGFHGASFQGDVGFRGARFQRGAKFDWARFRSVAAFGRASFESNADFVGASFKGVAEFDRVGFHGAAFNTASFHARVGFERAIFEGDAVFDAVSFEDRVWFGQVRFQGGVWFRVATFDDVGFREASFEHVAVFDEASFNGDAFFDKANFEGGAFFDKANFKGDAFFDKANFKGGAVFDGASFHGDAGFTGASFFRALEPGLMLVNGRLALDGVVLEHPVQLEIAAVALSCRRMRFRAGGHLRLVGAALSLEEAEIPAPLIVSAHQLDPDCEIRWRDLAPEASSPPRLVSVQRADVAGLAVTDLDLSVCQFAGAHHLDQLKITGSDTFRRVATGPLGSSRQVLAEECAWRDRTQSRRHRCQTTAQPIDTSLLEQAYQPGPAELAGIYRQLRKGREDQKNEPGAADFYFGEMEMRRAALPVWNAERVLLGLYYLVSGYALRAGRAVVALVLLVMVVAGLFVLWGLPETGTPSGIGTITGQPPKQDATFTLPTAITPPTPQTRLVERLRDPDRVERALRSALSSVVFRDTGQQFTKPGRYIEMIARFLGPVLLALAVLSVRNRVKR